VAHSNRIRWSVDRRGAGSDPVGERDSGGKASVVCGARKSPTAQKQRQH
jgi:hypothetical protein